ncbi:MAG TPA: phage baseplate assembly protein V [Bryobacteraceae bacterium]|jgi:uncharacterized protein involved in type VI secretion and phage assembly|nr:phage baseplate assembly protein V [Bryobacteraceae bacterium]
MSNPTLRAIVGTSPNLIQVAVEVRQELNQHGWCFVEFRATNDNRPPAEKWLGQNISVEATDENGTTTIFGGFVWQSELHHDMAGGYNVVLTGVTESWRLEVTHAQNAFHRQTLSEIAAKLAGEDGVSVSVTTKDNRPWQYLVQWGIPDMPFLVQRAYERRAWVRATLKGIEIRDAFSQSHVVSWADRLVHYAVVGRVGSPSCSGTYYDPATTISQRLREVKQAPSFLSANGMGTAVVSASQNVLPSSGTYRSTHAVSESDFQTRLEIESQRNLSQAYVIGITTEPRVDIGDKLEINGLPNADGDGSCGVLKVIHTWTQANGYKNEFIATLASQWMSAAPPEPYPPNRTWQVQDRPGLYPAGTNGSSGGGISLTDSRSFFWNDGGSCSRMVDSLGHNHFHLPQPYLGVVVARVVDNNDPEHMSRLKVQYIWADEPTDWIRIVSPNAGSDRGILFLPEVGDEVLVAFEDGDPNYALVIGSLWNSANNNQGVRAPFNSSCGVANNDIKRIVTKGGLRITFCDTGGEQGLTLVTPFASIRLLQNGAQAGLPMIALETTNGDILLSAPNGRVHINSKFYSKEIG